jgi:hypothetical protein
MLSCALHFEGAHAVSTAVADADAALAFGTIALLVISLIALVVVITLFRRIRDGLVKWYYRRKYAAEFRRRDQR